MCRTGRAVPAPSAGRTISGRAITERANLQSSILNRPSGNCPARWTISGRPFRQSDSEKPFSHESPSGNCPTWWTISGRTAFAPAWSCRVAQKLSVRKPSGSERALFPAGALFPLSAQKESPRCRNSDWNSGIRKADNFRTVAVVAPRRETQGRHWGPSGNRPPRQP